MELNKYKETIKISSDKNSITEHICEIIELFCDLANMKSVSYYKYHYGYNDYFYEFTLNEHGEHISKPEPSLEEEKIFLEDNGIVYGYFLVPQKIPTNPILNKLLKKMIKYLKKAKELEQKLYGDEIPFNLYLIHDNTLQEEAQTLKSHLKALLNVEIISDTSIEKYLEVLKSKETKHTIVFLINDLQTIQAFEDKIKVLNELIIVIGPNEHAISMYCGRLGIEHYISNNHYKAEDLKAIIVEKRNSLFNKNKWGNKIIALSGISGGIGATTIAMNMSDLITKNIPNKNLLYIDLSTTKAISNLFLEKNPLPEKSIVDLINSNEFNLENNLDNGLVKIRENFYAITGIQKHIDKEFIEKDAFIEKFLEYISASSDYFNFIIIDTGVADASNLKTTVYDIVNELWLITEMTLPHISQLKTFYSLLKRAGLKDKISFIVNRYDSKNAISVNDVTSILNMTSEDKADFDSFKIPNDYTILGKCWNYCELVSQSHKECSFIKKLNTILEDKEFYANTPKEESKKSWLSNFFKATK